MPFKSEKQRKWMHINKPEMAKDWEKKLAYSDKKEKKMKREQKVKELIKKMVREELIEVTQNMEMRKNFPGFNGNEYAVIDNWIDMNSLSKTIAMFKKHKKSFSQFVKDAAKARMFETTKRDYKAEYKKFQSSTKSKKYRAELNKYNRQKGTYGNGDGKDASHKGGKIVGFEKESVNRGRAEKSRLKKEGKLTEVSAGVNVWYFYKKANKDKNKFFKMLSDFRKKHSDTKWMKMLNYSLDDFNENPKKYKTIDDKQNKLFKNLQNNKKVREGKLTEDFKNNEWEVYVADEKGKEKIMKVAKSKRAGVILYNKLINTDKYHEVGMRVIKEGKLTEAKETIFDVAAKVMKDSQNYNYKSKKGMVKVDMQTANLLTKVFKKISPKMKKHLAGMGESNPAGLVQTLWAAVKW